MSSDFKLRFFFFKALYRFRTITFSFSLTSQSQRDVQIKRKINVHSYCRHRKFIVKLEHESLCPSLYLISKLSETHYVVQVYQKLMDNNKNGGNHQQLLNNFNGGHTFGLRGCDHGLTSISSTQLTFTVECYGNYQASVIDQHEQLGTT